MEQIFSINIYNEIYLIEGQKVRLLKQKKIRLKDFFYNLTYSADIDLDMFQLSYRFQPCNDELSNSQSGTIMKVW